MQVAIAGAGMIGAALAYAMSKRGAEVTVVDAARPAAGATGRSFGWINASFFADAAHYRLRAEGIEAYRRLNAGLEIPVDWAGCLCWEEQGPALEAQGQRLQDLGYPVDILSSREFRALEPDVRPPAQALRFRSEAATDPALLTQALLRASGARLLLGCRIEGIEHAQGQVTGLRIPGGVLPAQRVIVAGGTGSTALLDPLGVALPMLHRPGVIFRTQALPPTLSHVCVSPDGEFRQLANGQILMPTAVSHQSDTSDALATRPDALAEQACTRLQAILPRVPLRWQDVALAARPVPQDGLPVIGACGPEGLFAAVMHSGITLAPVVAEILSAEIAGQISNAQAAMVAPYRPDRFQSG